MAENTFRSYLFSKDTQTTKNYIQPNPSGESLVQILNDCLFASVNVAQELPMDIHPVSVINSIKNIIGDDRTNPSVLLLEFCIDYLSEFQFRETDQEKLDGASREGLGLTAFLGDLEDACQQGKWDEAELMTAKTFLASDRSRGVMDALCELALQDSLHNSLFIFHILRAYQFQEAKDDNWTYTTCVFDWIRQRPLPDPHDEESIEPDYILEDVVNGGDLIWFAAVKRLWEGDYVRIRGFRRELSFALNQFMMVDTSQTDQYKNDVDFNDPLLFIHSAEKLVSTKQSKLNIGNQLVNLESIRAMSRVVSSQQIHVLGPRLNQLIT